MISDQQLMKISLAISVIGIIALFFIANAIEPKQVSISEITNSMTGQYIIAKGMVNSIYENNGNLFLTLTDSSNEIKTVMFQKDRKNIDRELEKGDKVKVIGKIALYKNELEIIASSIEKI